MDDACLQQLPHVEHLLLVLGSDECAQGGQQRLPHAALRRETRASEQASGGGGPAVWQAGLEGTPAGKANLNVHSQTILFVRTSRLNILDVMLH